jgi:hypothetical protein
VARRSAPGTGTTCPALKSEQIVAKKMSLISDDCELLRQLDQFSLANSPAEETFTNWHST